MADIPPRAARAGVRIDVLAPGALGGRLFDAVLVDAPCSGSGAWRRQPEAKWRLDPERLDALGALQASVLRSAARHVRPGGRLVYATCSLLACENAGIVDRFLAETPEFVRESERRLTPRDGGDGFYMASMRRASSAS
jgi:16S rRNA (cytosine967-C5)-methyltransferase